MTIYEVYVTTYSCDIFSEGHRKELFICKEKAEEYILVEQLFDKYEDVCINKIEVIK